LVHDLGGRGRVEHRARYSLEEDDHG
jgi:hypothetical protein